MLFHALLLALSLCAGPCNDYTGLRMKMIQEQIETRGVKNPEVLRAMENTPRHVFVPEPEMDRAYADFALPIGYGATISQPYIVALMTQLLDVKPTHRILEIGTGSGYQAAILSQLAQHVYTMEIVPELAQRASATLEDLGYDNVTVRYGDGYGGWPEEAPFDRIILTAAPEEVPQKLLDQLKPGGKLVAPVGIGDQNLYVYDKLPDGRIRRTYQIGVRFVPMKHR